ncbi:MAG: hypothetical protein ABII82_07680 [Verrucomicrobiota bacterium]
MNTQPNAPSWKVRAPWPDELARLPTALRESLQRRGASRHWLWVLVTGDLERIVGAIALAEPEARPDAPRRGRIDWSLSPAWSHDRAAIEALLQAALERAAAVNVIELDAQAPLDGHVAACLEARGFSNVRTHEVWQLSVAANIRHRNPAIERMLTRRPIRVHPLDERSLEPVRALCSAHGLLAHERVELPAPATRNPKGLRPALCFVTGEPTDPSAVILGKAGSGQAYLEVLARNPSARAGGLEVAALLREFFLGADALDIGLITCVIEPARAGESLRLLNKAHARRTERFALFKRNDDSNTPQ